MAPIYLTENTAWIMNRAANKYAPVIVDPEQSEEAIRTMQSILRMRIATCQRLARTYAPSSDGVPSPLAGNSQFAFSRILSIRYSHWNSSTVPVLVISGGSAHKLAGALSKNIYLAWHPRNVRGAPVYLIVHLHDVPAYKTYLGTLTWTYPNFNIVGWNGGLLTGFGAARAAALAFAATLPYHPQRILMLDQDVVQTEDTRHTAFLVTRDVLHLHEPGRQVIGMGVGFAERQKVPKSFDRTPSVPKEAFNSPTQQFVSIMGPFRPNGKRPELRSDGVYPAYMVAGGEDMLMSRQQNMFERQDDVDVNTTLRSPRIIKMALTGPSDTPNRYWTTDRVATLKALYEVEKDIIVNFKYKGGALVKITLANLLIFFCQPGMAYELPF